MVWPLNREEDDNGNKKYSSVYNALQEAVDNFDSVFAPLELPDFVMDVLKPIIYEKLKPVVLKIKAEFEMTCYEFEGITTIKEVINKSLNTFSKEELEEIPINCHIISAPI